MNTTLTLTSLDTQLSNLDSELLKLQEAIAQKKALRKAITEKKNLATKAIAKLETALLQIDKTFEKLGESAGELRAIAESKIKDYFSPQQSKVVEFPVQEEPEIVVQPKENNSNDYFTWQPTSNKAVSNYFNVIKGTVQATYIGGSNKSRLQSVGSKLIQILPSVSFENREAKRLNTKHELKIVGLSDDDIGWLTQFNFNKNFYSQFATKLKFGVVDPELEIKNDNWIVAKGSIIKHRYFDYKCHFVESDGFGKAMAEDIITKETFEILPEDWQIDEDFQREAQFTLEALRGCKTLKELQIIKASNQINQDFLPFTCRNMPKGDRARIDKLCEDNKAS